METATKLYYMNSRCVLIVIKKLWTFTNNCDIKLYVFQCNIFTQVIIHIIGMTLYYISGVILLLEMVKNIDIFDTISIS